MFSETTISFQSVNFESLTEKHPNKLLAMSRNIKLTELSNVNYQIMIFEKLNVHCSQQHLRTASNVICPCNLFPVNCEYVPEISFPSWTIY